MPRERSPSRDKAFEIYREHKGNITNREIANMLGEDEKKVAVWKQRDKWNERINVVQQNSESCTTNKNKNKKSKNKEPKLAAITEVENSELTDKQRLFCIYYVKYWNATKAALKAGYSKETAYSIGHNLLKKVEVQDELNEMKRQIRECVGIETMAIVQKYIDIAFADITDFLIFGQEELPLMNAFGPVLDSKGNPVTRMVNTVKFRPWVNIDGTLISEISQGKDGAKLKLHDKMKALDWLANHMDLLDTATKEKLKLERDKFDFEKGKITKGNEKPIEIIIKRKGEGK